MENKSSNIKQKKNDEVVINVKREFVGDVTPIQAILPIILEDLRKKVEENRKIENKNKTD